MTWRVFDEIEASLPQVWYHAQQVPGTIFKFVRVLDASAGGLDKIVVKRWNFDPSGERFYFGNSRALWMPPPFQVAELSVEDPDFQENAGVAMYLPRRSLAFGVYEISVWDSPATMRFQFPFSSDDLDALGRIAVPHGLGTFAPSYNLVDSGRSSVNPNGVRFVSENEIQLDVSGYIGFSGIWNFYVERRG